MRVLIIGYTKRGAYEEFKNYIQNRKYLATGDYLATKRMYISKSGVTIEHRTLRQHCKDALQQYTEVDVSPLALKHMKSSDLDWIQSLTMMGDI